MRRWNDLSYEDQAKALVIASNAVLDGLIAGTLELPKLAQEKVIETIEEAERLQTPWFAAEMLAEVQEVMTEVMVIAEADAKEAFYPEDVDSVIWLD